MLKKYKELMHCDLGKKNFGFCFGYSLVGGWRVVKRLAEMRGRQCAVQAIFWLIGTTCKKYQIL